MPPRPAASNDTPIARGALIVPCRMPTGESGTARSIAKMSGTDITVQLQPTDMQTPVDTAASGVV
jgi:hypothetical protein